MPPTLNSTGSHNPKQDPSPSKPPTMVIITNKLPFTVDRTLVSRMDTADNLAYRESAVMNQSIETIDQVRFY